VSDRRRWVVGYHGTHVNAAATITSEQRFVPSANEWEWLGDGTYFWEENQKRAWEWATERFGPRAAVVSAGLDLGRCLDLANGVGTEALQEAFAFLERECTRQGEQMPCNHPSGARRLDCTVMNLACTLFHHVQTVRQAFEEGDVAYPGAFLRKQTHVQICVRDHACICPPIELVSRAAVTP